MILLGASILFTFGMLLLLISAIRITFDLIKLCFHLLVLAVLLAVAALLALCLVAQILLRWLRGMPASAEPEPAITITIDGEDDGPTIELPRASFRRLRG
jgi:hypothetical protein